MLTAEDAILRAMLKRSRMKKKSKEIETHEKNPHAVAMGKLGGKKGARALNASLTAEERSESARRAVNARWKKARKRKTHRVKP